MTHSMKSGFEFWWVLCLLAVLSTTTYAEARPNIIVIMADDLGYADVGCYGCKDIPTPHIDQLAEEGVRFTSGYVTYHMCGPSRAGFLTGRIQSTFGYYKNATLPFDPRQGLPKMETIASLLQKLGYVTGGVGKWHMGTANDQHPNSMGFDDWFGFLSGGLMYGVVLEQAITSLDIGATAIAMAGGDPMKCGLHGKDIRPYMTQQSSESPHDVLYWHTAKGMRPEGVIREGDFKLIITRARTELYNLQDDLSETTNLAALQPDRVQSMLARWQEWNKGNKPDLWGPPKKAYQYADYQWLKGSQHYKAKSQ